MSVRIGRTAGVVCLSVAITLVVVAAYYQAWDSGYAAAEALLYPASARSDSRDMLSINQESDSKSLSFPAPARSDSQDVLNIGKEIDLTGCKHVYLDMGSNVGIQVRKLFEPHLYPEAEVHPVFNANFGEDIEERRRTTCAVGFEPNFNHKERLKALEDAYNKCGWRTHFFLETAVSDHNGVDTLYTDLNKHRHFWSSNIVKGGWKHKGVAGQVRLLRLSDVINHYVAKRKMTNGEVLGKVVMKMDIEGSEVEVVPDVISSGAMDHVNLAYIEFHPRWAQTPERKAAERHARELVKAHNVNMIRMDDESYGLSDFPLPSCLEQGKEC